MKEGNFYPCTAMYWFYFRSAFKGNTHSIYSEYSGVFVLYKHEQENRSTARFRLGIFIQGFSWIQAALKRISVGEGFLTQFLS